MALPRRILRELRHSFNLGALVGQDYADVLTSAFNAAKLWNQISMQCTMVLTKLFSKCGQVQRNVVVTAIAVCRDLVSVLDALTKCSGRADVCHAALLSGSNYNRNETETNHNFGGLIE